MLTNVNNLFLGGNSSGRLKGLNSTYSKFNRTAKIQSIYYGLDKKYRRFCEGTDKITYRKVSAFACLLMLETGIRIGNENSAEGYVSKAPKTKDQILKTYGLTTLQYRHVSFLNDTMILDFVGKKSVEHRMVVKDPLLVNVGKQIFDNGFKFPQKDSEIWLRYFIGKGLKTLSIHSITQFIKASAGRHFTPKDFRTFRGNIAAAKTSVKLLKEPKDLNKGELKKELKLIIEGCSKVLGNTAGASKKSYINPEILINHAHLRNFKFTIKKRKNKVKEIFEKYESDNK